MASANAAPQVIRAYLSQQHFDNVENSCPMVALPSDVARSGRNVKRAFETVFKAMVNLLQRGSEANDRTKALAIAALCVGGMVVARATMDRNLADNLRRSCLAVALTLGGWQNAKPSGPEIRVRLGKG